MNYLKNNVQKNFAQNLRSLRKSYKLTMKELAQKLEFSQAKISHFENERYSPHIEDIVKIALFFNISTDELLGVKKINYSNINASQTLLTEEEVILIKDTFEKILLNKIKRV